MQNEIKKLTKKIKSKVRGWGTGCVWRVLGVCVEGEAWAGDEGEVKESFRNKKQ